MADEWHEYRQLVLKELERLNTELDLMRSELGKNKTQIALLNLKAGFVGLVGGMIPAAIMLIMKFLN